MIGLPGPAARRLEWQAGLSAAMAAVIAYAAALAGTFVYDDLHSVAGNPGVHTLGNALRFFADPGLFSATDARMYRPVLLLSFASDWTLGGGSPLSFKLTSVLLHAGATWLLFRLARGHGASPFAAALCAAWFAVHPLASETVNMVSARSEALLLAGVLLALNAHLGLLRGHRLGATGVLLGTLVACGSKETGVVVPLLLAVQEWLRAPAWQPPGRLWRAGLRRVGPALLLVLAYLLARKLLLGQATATLLGREGHDPMYGHTRDLLTQIATMGAALPGALLQALLPVGLTLDPRVDYHRSLLDLPVLCGWLGLAAATALAVAGGRARPLCVTGAAVAWLLALPWIVLPLNVPLAEHRMYGVLAGLALIAAAALDRLPLAAALGSLPRLPRPRWPLALGALALLVLAGLSAARSLAYRDEAILWRSALARDPLSFRAHWGLGLVHRQRGDLRAAEASLARAVAIYPRFRAARRTWVECLLNLPAGEGWPFRALVAAEELARQKDDDPYYRLLHANALLQAGMVREDPAMLLLAEERVLSCLLVGEPKALVFRLAAECRRQLGDLDGALAHHDRALALGLDFASLRAERSEVLRALGREDEADRELREAFQRSPTDGTVRAAWARRFPAGAPR